MHADASAISALVAKPSAIHADRKKLAASGAIAKPIQQITAGDLSMDRDGEIASSTAARRLAALRGPAASTQRA